MLFDKRVEFGSKEWAKGEVSSPTRAELKKAVVAMNFITVDAS